MRKPVRLGLIGLGTVGAGVVEVLTRNRKLMEEKIGAPIELARVCDLHAPSFLKKYGLSKKYGKSATELIEDPTIDIVIELIGGYEPARTFVLNALKNGKHVVTANKALLAKYWTDV